MRESEQARRLADDLRGSEERYHRANGRVASLELYQKVLEESERRAREELRETQRAADQRDAELRRTFDELGRTHAEIERLNELRRAMESTRAWRFHQWWQRRKPMRGAS